MGGIDLQTDMKMNFTKTTREVNLEVHYAVEDIFDAIYGRISFDNADLSA